MDPPPNTLTDSRSTVICSIQLAIFISISTRSAGGQDFDVVAHTAVQRDEFEELAQSIIAGLDRVGFLRELHKYRAAEAEV